MYTTWPQKNLSRTITFLPVAELTLKDIFRTEIKVCKLCRKKYTKKVLIWFTYRDTITHRETESYPYYFRKAQAHTPNYSPFWMYIRYPASYPLVEAFLKICFWHRVQLSPRIFLDFLNFWNFVSLKWVLILQEEQVAKGAISEIWLL